MPKHVCFGCGGPSSSYRTSHNEPLCGPCYSTRQARGLDAGVKELREPGVDYRFTRGVDETGKRPDGAVDWWFRQPQEVCDLHHDEPIQLAGRECYQQSPPVHVAGTPPKRPSGTTRKTASLDAAVDCLVLTADLTDRERTAIKLRIDGLTRREIAETMGVTERTAKRLVQMAYQRARRSA